MGLILRCGTRADQLLARIDQRSQRVRQRRVTLIAVERQVREICQPGPIEALIFPIHEWEHTGRICAVLVRRARQESQ